MAVRLLENRKTHCIRTVSIGPNRMSITRKTPIRSVAVMASALLLFACGEDTDEVSATDVAETDLDTALAGISRDNIQSHLDYLAADEREGRMAGSRGYDDAAKYVADQFAAIGLEPGGTDGWMQPIPFITRMLDVENSGVTLHKSDGDVDLEHAKNLIIYADKLRDQNQIRAEVVFAGFGVHAPELGYSDFDGVDVNGKIVATFTKAPSTFPSTERAHFASGRTKAAELVGRGAIGQITLMSRLLERMDPWENWTPNLGKRPGLSWIDEAGEVADFHPELEGDAMFNRQAAEQLFDGAPITFEDALDAAEQDRPSSRALGVEVTMIRSSTHERILSANVIGMLRGSDPELADEYVVYSTHLDHLGIGSPVDGDSHVDQSCSLQLPQRKVACWVRIILHRIQRCRSHHLSLMSTSTCR